MSEQQINKVNVLTTHGWVWAEKVIIRDGRVASIDSQGTASDKPCSNDQHRYLLPGMIDAHGDAFERHIAPRTSSTFPLNLALAANDAELIGAGITTFFLSITDGFEPGIRSRETVRNLVNTIETLRGDLNCDTRIHIRHEQANTQDHEELVTWLNSGRVDLLSLNNHVPELEDSARIERFSASLNRRLSMNKREVKEFINELQKRLPLGHQQVETLAQIAHANHIPLASHDDKGDQDVADAVARGVSIAEFPMTLDVAKKLKAANISVLVGAPNLVRGGSHIGALGASEAIGAQQVDMLCSDYYYPALFNAPFQAVAQGLCSFPEAWRLVSEAPARALGLGDKTGKIALNYDADLLLLDRLDGSPLSLRQVWVKGELALNRSKIRDTVQPA